MPEKSLPEISRSWREQYEKGRAAFERNNLDYAIEILTQVVQHEPAFFECRQALRAAQFKRTGQASKTFFKKIMGSTNPRLVQAQLAVRSNATQALNLAEEVLNGDPNNLGAHKVLAEAALSLDLPRTAVLSLEIAFKQAPRDRDVAMRLAQAFIRVGQGRRAEGILEELNRVHPYDSEITQALKDAAASRTMNEGGYGALADGKGSYRDILRDEKEAVTLEQEKRDHRTEQVTDRLVTEYEARAAAEPDNLRLLRGLAEMYVERKDFPKARACYERLMQGQAVDPSLEQVVIDLRIREFDHRLAQLDPQVPDQVQQAAQLRAEKDAFVLESCQHRVEHYPNDLQFRFELGQLYLQAGRVTEAIQEFQKAQNNPHKRIAALFQLGNCFARRGMNDLAARTYLNAIKEKPVFDDEKKELIYALGLALDKMGKKEEAIEQFKAIYEIDIGYRDIAARVDAYYAGQASPS